MLFRRLVSMVDSLTTIFDIHQLMDSSKATIADMRHRALTHNAWFIGTILELVFGVVRQNSDGKTYSVRDIGEQHVLEDYGHRFIPSAQDFLQEIEMKDWMNNGRGTPPSNAKILKKARNDSRNAMFNQRDDFDHADPERPAGRAQEDDGSDPQDGQGPVHGRDRDPLPEAPEAGVV